MLKSNKDIAHSLLQFSDLLEATGDNPYKVRAYRRAARSIAHWEEEIQHIINEGRDLKHIPWIGKGIASTIEAMIKQDKEPVLPNKKFENDSLRDLRGIGTIRYKQLKALGISTRTDLVRAITHQELNHIKWLTPKLVQQITENKRKSLPATQFIRLYHALPINQLLLSRFQSVPKIKWVEPCGDFRRRKEVLEHLNYLIATDDFPQVIECISQFREVTHIVQQEVDTVIFSLHTGICMQVSLFRQPTKAVALLYKTGSPNHLHHLERYAQIHGFQLTQEGLVNNNKMIPTNSEEALYNHLGLSFIVPELREGIKEIEAAHLNLLPTLIELKDIKGDLHTHTTATDGKETLHNMVQGAIDKGYEYYAITDHSKRLRITNGLDEKRLLQQIEQINELNESQKSILILKAIEVDILEDGSLDLSNEVLKELDFTVCSVHSKFKLPEKQQTERIIRAMDNPYFNILGHATGRLIKSRPPYPIDMEKILKAAAERGCFIELNAQPYRLDINDSYCQLAKDLGVKVAISSDAHSIRELDYMQLGIFQGRRGWLEKNDVINTYTWPQLKKLFKRS
jgi:DNA polymerase (family X)